MCEDTHSVEDASTVFLRQQVFLHSVFGGYGEGELLQITGSVRTFVLIPGRFRLGSLIKSAVVLLEFLFFFFLNCHHLQSTSLYQCYAENI